MTIKVFSHEKYAAQLNVCIDADKGTIDVNVILFRMRKDRAWIPEKKWKKHFQPQDLKAANALYEHIFEKADDGTAPEEIMQIAGGNEN